MPGPGMELIGEEEYREVVDVMKSGYLFRYGVSIGDDADSRFRGKVFRAEREFAEFCGVDYAVAVNSGTSALLATFAGLAIGPGDEVIAPGYTFIASLSSIIFSGAIPVLTEIDRSFNLDPEDVEAKLTPRTKAILAVHMAGNPARLAELRAIADKHGIYLIEDCAQACGATYRGKRVGSIGDAGAFSFNVYKVITSGDGGMITTNNEETYRRAFAFHDQGHSPLRTGVEVGNRPFIGLDLRFTELQAAVLLGQIGKTDRILTRLRQNKARYMEALKDIPGLEFREITDEGECATVLTVVFPDADTAVRVAADLGTKVIARAGWHVYNNMEQILEKRTVTGRGCPFHCGYYEEQGGKIDYRQGMLPRTDALLERSINIGIGVDDANLGSGFGTTINDSDEVIDERASRLREVASRYLASGVGA
jgi:dTDP-4-amino-4,6-dideoxygalactose transaminase